ncbi:MAG: hypothetical protein M0041_05940, partial [Nitrospiraceae bacterium]|nr:hypothetical protein [Nitrospiraceae bacterium]
KNEFSTGFCKNFFWSFARPSSVFKNDLNQKGMVKPIGLSARSFFLHAGYAGSILNRKYPFPNYPPMGIGALTDSDAWEAMSRGDSEGTGLGGI